MTEYEKAAKWRNSLGLTQQALGEKLGYSKEAVCWFEAGLVPPSARKRTPVQRKIAPWVWRRYKLACAGLATELQAQPFNWEAA